MTTGHWVRRPDVEVEGHVVKLWRYIDMSREENGLRENREHNANERSADHIS